MSAVIPIPAVASNPSPPQGVNSLSRRWGVPALIISAVVAATAGHAANRDTDGEVEARVIAAVNSERAAHSLSALAVDPRLERAARERAAVIAGSGVLSHVEPDGTRLEDRLARAGYAYRVAAENLSEGTKTPEQTVALWLQSPLHRDNILIPDIADAGVGHARSAAGRDYWVLIVGGRLKP